MHRQALRTFCREGGISRNAAEAHLHKLEHHIRAAADASAPRAMAVLRPLRLVLANLAADHREEVAAKARRLQVVAERCDAEQQHVDQVTNAQAMVEPTLGVPGCSEGTARSRCWLVDGDDCRALK